MFVPPTPPFSPPRLISWLFGSVPGLSPLYSCLICFKSIAQGGTSHFPPSLSLFFSKPSLVFFPAANHSDNSATTCGEKISTKKHAQIEIKIAPITKSKPGTHKETPKAVVCCGTRNQTESRLGCRNYRGNAPPLALSLHPSPCCFLSNRTGELTCSPTSGSLH